MLLDDGVLTQSEFDEQKSRILGYENIKTSQVSPFPSNLHDAENNVVRSINQDSYGIPSSIPKSRKSMRIWAIICFCLTAVYLIMSISERTTIAMALFTTILGVMFLILSRSPKGQRYIGKTNIAGKGINKSVFVIICVLVAFLSFRLVVISIEKYTNSNDTSSSPQTESIPSTPNSESDTVPSQEDNTTDKKTSDDWLSFDKRAWKDYKKLYTSHKDFMQLITQYADGKITQLDYYNQLKELNTFFKDQTFAFSYGTDKDENTYLGTFLSWTTSNQVATEKLMKYLDTNSVKDFSSANEHIQLAKDAAVMIIQNRRLLWEKAGLSEEEIEKKIETLTKELSKIDATYQ
jgi:hypothetical protein